MNKIQDIYKCFFFTPNDNLNKTCADRTRCCVFYEVTCPIYMEVTDEYKKKVIEAFRRKLEQAAFKNEGDEECI